MDTERVPMTYAIAKISHEASLVFELLYLIYGTAAYIFIYKILRQRQKCE